MATFREPFVDLVKGCYHQAHHTRVAEVLVEVWGHAPDTPSDCLPGPSVQRALKSGVLASERLKIGNDESERFERGVPTPESRLVEIGVALTHP